MTRWLALIGLVVYGPLLIFGLPAGHDAPAHSLWADALAKGWEAGLPYPRWVDAAADGLGAPALRYRSR